MGKWTYMKNEAVKTRPMASVNTERVGYHESGTGLVIGFGAFQTPDKTQNQRKWKHRRNTKNLQKEPKKIEMEFWEVLEDYHERSECRDYNGRSCTFYTWAEPPRTRWLPPSFSQESHSLVYIQCREYHINARSPTASPHWSWGPNSVEMCTLTRFKWARGLPTGTKLQRAERVAKCQRFGGSSSNWGMRQSG